MIPNHLKERLMELFGPAYRPARDYVFGPMWGQVTNLLNPDSHLYWAYIVSAALISLLVYLLRRDERERFSWNGFFGFLIPRNIFFHRSAVVDYKFLFVNAIVLRVIYGSAMLGSAQLFAGHFKSALQFAFGESGPRWHSSWVSMVPYTVLVIMAHDLGFTIGHYLEHRIPFFWEFHKVHHSAEVLTPLTNFRHHPLDRLLELVLISVFMGIVVASFGYLYVTPVTELMVLNISVLYFMNYLPANLRHSHISLSYGWHLDHVFSSPAMHQVHHSSEPGHFNKNFALVFSFWDYLLGTLYVPKRKEAFSWGLPDREHLAYNNLWNLYVLPFKNNLALIGLRRPKPQREL